MIVNIDNNLVVDATPVDLSVCYLVFVEGRSLDANFNYKNPVIARLALYRMLFHTRNDRYVLKGGSLQTGYEDLAIVVATERDAIRLVTDLNIVLPAASDYWSDAAGLSPGINAYTREYPMDKEGNPDLDRPGPVNFIS